MDLKNREDRIGKYLTPFLNDYIFDELSDNYLQKSGLADILSGVPVPIRKNEIESISTLSIAKAMAFVIGCDPKFEYSTNYISYILRVSDKRFASGLIAEGVEWAQKRDYDYACVQFRAAMMIDPDNIDAVYCYGRALRDAYETADEEDFIARFKLESIEAFEEVTMKKPDHADAFYFLGYGYINLGLYVKAKLTWQEFMALSGDEEKKKEIQALLDNLDDPVRIEEGYNKIISGRFEEGVDILSEYKDSRYKDWWPLWYYLGVASMELGKVEEAAGYFKAVLKLSPSNQETMKELVKAYELLGDEEMARKYRKKISVVAENAEKDRIEALERENSSGGKIS